MKIKKYIWTIVLVMLVLTLGAALTLLTAPIFASLIVFTLSGSEVFIEPDPAGYILSGNLLEYGFNYSLGIVNQGYPHAILIMIGIYSAIIAALTWDFWRNNNPSRKVEDGVLGDSVLLDSSSLRKKKNVLWDGEGDAPGASLVYGYEKGNMIGDPDFAHGWVDAKSGCGKSRSIGYPSLYWNVKAGSSIIYTARKLTDYKLTAEAIENDGVKTFLLDLERPKRGYRFNLMDTVNSFVNQDDIAAAQKSARQLAADFIKHDGKNPFFSSAARALLTAVILIVALSNAKPEEKNLASVAKIIRSGMTGAGDDPAAPLKDYIRSLGVDSAPYKAAAEFLQDNGSTSGRNVASTLMTGITILSDEGIEWMLSGSDFTLRQLLEEQCVLFPHCLGEDDPYNVILSAMYNQLWTIAQEVANENGEKLPHPFVILGDEWGNLPRVDCLGEMVSLGRSMDFHVFIFVQNFSQLNKYNNSGDSGAGVDKILGSMNLQIAMSVMKTEPDGEYFSKLAGKKTVRTRSDNQSQAGGFMGKTSQGHSMNEQQVDLLPPYSFKDRVPLRDGIVVIKGGENDAPGNEGIFRMPLVDATKIKHVSKFFGLGSKKQDQQRCAEVETTLRQHAATVDPTVPTWCPDFALTESQATHEANINHDEGLEWD